MGELPDLQSQTTGNSFNGLTFLILLIVVAAAARPSRGPAFRGPNLGPEAGAQDQGCGLSVASEPVGAHLGCSLQRLVGYATPRGLWVSSADGMEGRARSMRWRFRGAIFTWGAVSPP